MHFSLQLCSWSRTPSHGNTGKILARRMSLASLVCAEGTIFPVSRELHEFGDRFSQFILVFDHPAKSDGSPASPPAWGPGTVPPCTHNRSCPRAAGAEDSAHRCASATRRHAGCRPLGDQEVPHKVLVTTSCFKEVLQSSSPQKTKPSEIQPGKHIPQHILSAVTTEADPQTRVSQLQLWSS